jgi:hypothetical protein
MSDPRAIRNESSIRSLQSYLSTVLREPEKYLDDTRLMSALSSQSSLAKFELIEKGITAMSLNTAKRAAAAAFEDEGFERINRLRIDCVDALSKTRKSRLALTNRVTKHSLTARAQAAEQQVQRLSEDLQIATSLLHECMMQARSYAKRADEATQVRCDKDQRDLIRMLGLIRRQSM